MLRKAVITWLGCCLLVLSGCQAFPLFSGMKFPEADARHPVVEVLCVWEAAEGRGLDNLPCRGFGGQILFFSGGRKEPVKVEGEVRIYVFDEQGVDGDPSKPIHQFDFPAAAWNTFLRPSNVGASYQLFVPYTRKGTHPATCTLRVRITPEGGLPVYSRLATVILAGHRSDVKKKADAEQIVTVSGDSTPESGQGVVTADWSEMVHDPHSAAQAMSPSKNPGITFATHQDAGRNAQVLEKLREAARDAAETEPSEPPRRLQPDLSGKPLQPLRSLAKEMTPETGVADELSEKSLESRDESHDLNAQTRPKRRHPLAE